MELSPYQIDGAAFLAARHRAGLFDEPGAGKTAIAIHACDLSGIRNNILVVAPRIAKRNWATEFGMWGRMTRTCVPARDIHDVIAWQKGRRDVLILSYEQARSWKSLLREDLIDVCIADESHYLKTPGSGRTKALLGEDCDGVGGVAARCGTMWQMTGTPAPNDAADAWTFLRSTGATRLDRPGYIRRYFNSRSTTYGSRQKPKPEMLSELIYLHKSFSIRRTLAEVGYQLPPLRISTIDVEGDTTAIRELLRNTPGLEAAIRKAIELGGLSHLKAEHIATLRRYIGEAKSIPIAEMVVEELRSGLNKLVVMGIHVQALANVSRIVKEAGFKTRLLAGAVSSEIERDAAVRAFQNDPEERVIVCNMTVASTALTMHAADQVLVLEQDWTPATNYQSIKRVHRRGQTRPVLARFARLVDSLDEEVAASIAEKTRNIAALDISSVLDPEQLT